MQKEGWRHLLSSPKIRVAADQCSRQTVGMLLGPPMPIENIWATSEFWRGGMLPLVKECRFVECQLVTATAGCFSLSTERQHISPFGAQRGLLLDCQSPGCRKFRFCQHLWDYFVHHHNIFFSWGEKQKAGWTKLNNSNMSRLRSWHFPGRCYHLEEPGTTDSCPEEEKPCIPATKTSGGATQPGWLNSILLRWGSIIHNITPPPSPPLASALIICHCLCIKYYFPYYVLILSYCKQP